jgi:UPF0755 protein
LTKDSFFEYAYKHEPAFYRINQIECFVTANFRSFYAGGGVPSVLKKALLLIGVSFLIVVGIVTGLYIELKTFAATPANQSNSASVIITVHPGQTLNSTADMLYREKIIKNSLKFVLIARLKGYDKRLKAGEYLLSATMTPLELLDIMVRGAVKLYKLTIPEGYNIYQIAELVDTAKLGAKADFIQAATDSGKVRSLGLAGETFEGYLFPDTYFFSKDVSTESIIETMVKRFWSVFVQQWRTRAQEVGMTVHQIVTLASIIEKETGAAFERPIISSVFHNRLKKKMRLESDPTVIYGIKNFDGNLTKKHLTTPTPYNTYKIRGLPVGPIANPGRASLEAALYPEDTKYIYFVSRKDSTHQFSTTLKQHNLAVRKYQLRRRKRNDK